MFRIEDVQALGNLLVADIIKTDVVTVTSNTPLIEIIRIFRDRNFEGIPVVDNGELKGVAMRRELLNFYVIPSRDLDAADTKKLFQLVSLMNIQQPVSTFMNSEPLTIQPDCKVSKLAQLMLENDLFTVPVVRLKKILFRREKKQFIGIVTLTDMMPLLYEAICC